MPAMQMDDGGASGTNEGLEVGEGAREAKHRGEGGGGGEKDVAIEGGAAGEPCDVRGDRGGGAARGSAGRRWAREMRAVHGLGEGGAQGGGEGAGREERLLCGHGAITKRGEMELLVRVGRSEGMGRDGENWNEQGLECARMCSRRFRLGVLMFSALVGWDLGSCRILQWVNCTRETFLGCVSGMIRFTRTSTVPLYCTGVA